MGDVWTAVALLIKFFNNYAGKGGNPNTLSKSELKALLQDQFGVELKVSDLQPHFSILPKPRCTLAYCTLKSTDQGYTEVV